MPINYQSQTNIHPVKGRKNIRRAAEIVRQSFGDEFVQYFISDLAMIRQTSYASLYGYFEPDGELWGVGLITKLEGVDFAMWGVTWIAVDESKRKTGIATKILDTIECYAMINQENFPSNYCIIQLTTSIPEFYEKRGYRLSSGWGDTALMIKDLTARLYTNPKC